MLRLSALLLALALPAAAQDLARVTDRQAFLSRVGGQDLSRMGITVQVQPDGSITGSAFGAPVTGSWEWTEGFFCRQMSWGPREWERNCQAVYTDGATVRFVADRGEGDTADLTLE